MDLQVEGAQLRGEVRIPGSKSHTIRAVALAALAEGESIIRSPLESSDARAAFAAYTALGATIQEVADDWRVQGTGGILKAPAAPIDVGNSGTTMNVALGSAALLPQGEVVLTGDEQVQRRPNGPLAQALNDLGAVVRSERDNGCPPFRVQGRLQGGEATMEAMTSQYVTSLLLNAPYAEQDTVLHVPLMHEKPYVHITLDWLRRMDVDVRHDEELTEFHIPGGQRYKGFDRAIPGDFSSATFFLAAGALQDNEVLCRGLDMEDTQGDKEVVHYLREMGARVQQTPEGILAAGEKLQGCELDLNATPDALPMLAVLGCFAAGTTRLVNVPQARLKETDRIAVMRLELEKLGAKIEELEDGLIIHESPLRAGDVDGHGDHRVVMALAVCASQLSGTTTIRGYEAVNITYPGFLEALQALGGQGRIVD